MTPEQKRIQALEDTVLELVTSLEDARMGFGSRFAQLTRRRVGQNRRNAPFTAAKQKAAPTPPPVEATPPAAPVKGAAA